METHGATPALGPPSDGCPPMYRPRDPRASPLFQLFETHYETVKSVWEERFESQYGFWQGRWDRAVAAYLDCGLFESGFAIVRCPVCKAEFHVAFSCRCRGLCPSCSAKRAAIFSELLEHRILADVPHAQWVFSIRLTTNDSINVKTSTASSSETEPLSKPSDRRRRNG